VGQEKRKAEAAARESNENRVKIVINLNVSSSALKKLHRNDARDISFAVRHHTAL
jgi:hypothetical protein